MGFIQQYKKPIIGGALLVIMAGLLWYGLKPQEVQAVVVARQDYVPSLLLSGEVVVSQSTVISALNSGTILNIPVAKGEKVSKGQLLIQVDDTQACVERDKAAVAVQSAQSQLQKAETVTRQEALAKSVQADLARDKAQLELERVAALEKAGAVSRIELEEAERNLKIAQESSLAARAAAQSLEANGSNIAILQAELEQCQLDLKEKELVLEQFMSKAPADGELLDIYVQPGELVSNGSRVALLAAVGNLRIKVQPDQRYAELAALRNKAQVWISNSPDTKWDAEIVYTEPSGNAEQGSVTVELEIIGESSQLYPGQLLSVHLFVPSQTDAMIIPENLLASVNGQTGVWLAIDNRARFTPLQIGFRTGEGIVITSGLDENDLVLQPEGLSEDQKILPQLEEAVNHEK